MTRKYKRTPCGDCGRPVEIPRSMRCLGCQRERQRKAAETITQPAPIAQRAAGARIRYFPSACPPTLRDYAGSEPTRPYVPNYYRGRRRMI